MFTTCPASAPSIASAASLVAFCFFAFGSSELGGAGRFWFRDAISTIRHPECKRGRLYVEGELGVEYKNIESIEVTKIEDKLLAMYYYTRDM